MSQCKSILVYTNQNFYNTNLLLLNPANNEEIKNLKENDKKLKNANTLYPQKRNKPLDLQKILKDFPSNPITLENITNNRENFEVINLKNTNGKTISKDDEQRLVFQLAKTIDDNYYVKTGLYAGVITIKGITFNIMPKNIALFKRMLNFANNIYVDKTESNSEKSQEPSDFPLFEYLFLTSLKKASVLGFPQEYSKVEYHDIRVHGNIDVNSYIKKDIPFIGKLSSKRNERQYVQCIVDVLSAALSACKNDIQKMFPNLSFVSSELKAAASGRRPTLETIQKAKNHRALHNPMFAPFRRTLDYAELILRKQNLISSDNEEASNKISGYLLDVASLWELYLENLLRNNFQSEGWTISAQEELSLYEETFFARNNYPDLVMRHEDGRLVVLDAKFKKMDFARDRYGNCDVDRTDLFQIQSYAGYYREKGENIVLCGLIYPLSQDPIDNKTYLYGPGISDINFIIDGIYIGDEKNFIPDQELPEQESAFIERLKKIINH